ANGDYLRSGLYGGFHINDKREGLEMTAQKHPGSKVVEDDLQWGKWFEWGFFRIRCYKKGTVHFEFREEKDWIAFNQKVAKIKGYPLPEKKEQTKYQAKQNGHGRGVEPMAR